MKKTIFASAIALIIAGSAIAQPVSDRAVIPIGVTLQQILRIHVINGGNVEFVFNTITDYTTGIANGATGFYDSDVIIASSTDWRLNMGAEDAPNMLGTDNPANILNINNVGFTAAWTGTNSCCAAGSQVVTGATYLNCATGTGLIANGLAGFVVGAGGSVLFTDGGNVLGSGGTVLANAFTLNWEVGTFVAGGSTPMNTVSILAQSPVADRYTTNVFLDLTAL